MTKKRALSPRVSEVVSQFDGPLPVWVRAPMTGVEHFTGFSRTKLYDLANKKLIRSISIREPGQVKGTRLFNLKSILEYIELCERRATQTSPSESDPFGPQAA